MGGRGYAQEENQAELLESFGAALLEITKYTGAQPAAIEIDADRAAGSRRPALQRGSALLAGAKGSLAFAGP